jgi:hypothetical protein
VSAVQKPKRIWALQAVLSLQLIGAIVGIVGAFASGLPALPAAALVLGFAKPVCALVLLPVLVLALQRVLPRSERVAPPLAAVWALFTIGVWMTSIPRPLPPSLESITFQDVTPEANRISFLATRAVALGAMVWVVASLFVHHRTREYLAGNVPKPVS